MNSLGAETIHGNQLTLAGYPVHSFLSLYGKAADPTCLFALIWVEQIYTHIQLVGFEPPTIPQVAKPKTTTSYYYLCAPGFH